MTAVARRNRAEDVPLDLAAFTEDMLRSMNGQPLSEKPEDVRPAVALVRDVSEDEADAEDSGILTAAMTDAERITVLAKALAEAKRDRLEAELFVENLRKGLVPAGNKMLDLHPRMGSELVLTVGPGSRIAAITEAAAGLESIGESPRIDFVRDTDHSIMGLGLWLEAKAS